MNKDLEFHARSMLMAQLALVPEKSQELFKLMYGRLGGKRSVADTKAMSIEEVVAEMEAEKLDWAMTQVDNTIAKLPQAQQVEGG